MPTSLVRISKFLSLVLRHHPERIGLTLDDNGWIDVDRLLSAAPRAGVQLDYPTLVRVVRENDKQRFSISEDGKRIRANQGHSVDIDLQLQPVAPPEVLYHGTVARFRESIHEHGLRPGSRQHVHLSPDRETAAKVGARRGQPVILVVQAGAMHRAGLPFYRAANGVWLCNHVPPQYVSES